MSADSQTPGLLRDPKTGIEETKPRFKRDRVATKVSRAMGGLGYDVSGEGLRETVFSRKVEVWQGSRRVAFPVALTVEFEADSYGNFKGIRASGRSTGSPVPKALNVMDADLGCDMNPLFVSVQDLRRAFDRAAPAIYAEATPSSAPDSQP